MAEVEAPSAPKTVTENFVSHLTDYVETYAKLTALNATQKATEVATISFTAVLVAFFGMIIMIFLGFGLAAVFTETMPEKTSFFLVTLIYVVIGSIVLAFRKKLIFPFLRNQIISKIYDK